MHKKIPSLMLALAAAGAFSQASAASNEDIVKRHFASLVAGQPKTAELGMFLNMMPKGGDLHHHYSGSIYAEQYLEWIDQKGYCIVKASSTIETKPDAIAAERAKPEAQRACVSAADLVKDNHAYRELMRRWSVMDYFNVEQKLPPDVTFFDTFYFFNDIAAANNKAGLQRLKQRAIDENVSYIETIFELAPFTQDTAFDSAAQQAGADYGRLHQQFAAYEARLEADAGFKQSIDSYIASVDAGSEGIDDENFTMRYQAYVLRLLSPSQVFSSLVAGFKAASQNPKVVSVNIVGAEHYNVSMRDYSMHMQMYKYLRAKYPQVKLALHAGELALGMVPPEGLKFHITEAVNIGGANRIGHGMDIAHERNPLALLKTMAERDIPVEVNLTSNFFIEGVKGEAHPLTLYRKYGVPFVLSSDDTGVARNNLSGEYLLFATRYKTDYAEIKKLSYASLRYSFLAGPDKQRLLKALDVKFKKFEADIATALQKQAVK